MNTPLALHRSRQRVSSRGFEPLLGGLGLLGDPSADMLAAGLRVPYAPTSGAVGRAPLVQRYLFQLCSIGIGEGLWLTSLGQLSVLGYGQLTSGGGGGLLMPGKFGIVPDTAPIFPNVIEQTSAAFRFADCHAIRWGVRRVRKPRWNPIDPLSTNSFVHGWTDNPALKFETATFAPGNLDWKGTPDDYLTLTSYTAPGGGGVFPGEPVGGDLGCFDSLDFPWSNPDRKALEPVWVRPGGQLVFYAMVDQTAPESRVKLQVPASFPLPPTGMPENAFICDWPLAQQFAVGGSMTVEMRPGPSGGRLR